MININQNNRKMSMSRTQKNIKYYFDKKTGLKICNLKSK